MGALRKAGVWLGLVEDDDELEYDDPAYDKSYSSGYRDRAARRPDRAEDRSLGMRVGTATPTTSTMMTTTSTRRRRRPGRVWVIARRGWRRLASRREPRRRGSTSRRGWSRRVPSGPRCARSRAR